MSYRLEVKKPRTTGADKSIVEERKKQVQKRFREEMGLLVDVVKPGYGTTNDGNTARRFFENAEKSAEITGVSAKLISRFGTILEVIRSSRPIDTEVFTEYTEKTAEMWVELYSWCYMTPTVHKLLMHGGVIIAQAILPIGILSEEASEACNKFFKRFRTGFARQKDGVSNNRDVINRLLLMSDPFLSGSRQLYIQQKKNSEEAKKLFLRHHTDENSDNEDIDSDSDFADEDDAYSNEDDG